MNRVKKFLVRFLVFVSLACVAYLAFIVFRSIRFAFSSLSKEVWAAIITAVSAVFAATLPIAIGRYYERKQDNNRRLIEKKMPVYEGFLQKMVDIISLSKRKDDSLDNLSNDEEFIKFFMSFAANVIIYGSEDLIKTYSDWRLNASSGSSLQQLLNLEKVLFQIRKDLGNSNSKLNQGDLLQMFLSDDVKALVANGTVDGQVERPTSIATNPTQATYHSTDETVLVSVRK